ncbi:MAG TPA: polyprenyl synthetase family protein, partial [Spongiibacteraceae bacterium]|nr:polyprenyl synthetase family protein [Spongiibacteraceae bacterium]
GLLAGETAHPDPSTRIRLVTELAAGAGAGGMVGGQMRDIEGETSRLNDRGIAQMQAMKTGALIRAAVALGARVAGADDSQLAQLDRYAGAIGLAFQVQDDILDVVGDSAVTGKRQGGDLALGKATYPALLGLDAARELLTGLHRDADAALEGLDAGADRLRQLAAYIVQRTH